MVLANSDPVSILPSQIPSVPLQSNAVISYFISAYTVLRILSTPIYSLLSTHFLCLATADPLIQKNFWCPKGTCLNYTSGGQSLYILLVGTVKSLFYAC